jgi:protease II
MLHKIGQPQAQDACILEERRPEWHLLVSRTHDWAYLTLTSACKTSTEVRHPPKFPAG